MGSAGNALPAPRMEVEARGVEEAVLRLRLAQDAAGIGIWDWNLATGELSWDAHWAALFGTTLGEFEASIAGFDARTHPEDLPRVHAALRQAIDTAGAVQVEYRAVWADGTVRRLLSRGQALIDPDGQVRRVLGAVVDVTELRAAVDAEALAARRLAALAEVALQLARWRPWRTCARSSSTGGWRRWAQTAARSRSATMTGASSS
ncbi:MAG: PAS domain-containing protein [Actinomycetota bacterium]|nr:PAS domain-containing protein [Actinomycetota bacterium]